MAPSRGTTRLGEGNTCPHCGAKAGVAQDDEGYACLVCGGPVILVDQDDATRARAEKPLLEEAKKLRARRAAWAVGSSLIGIFALLSAALALAVISFVDIGFGASIALGAIVLVPLLLAVVGWRKALGAGNGAAEALAQAQRTVAAELVAANPNVAAADLAQRLHISEDKAVELIAHAQLTGLLSPASAGDVKFRVDGALDDESAADTASSAEQARHGRGS